MLFRNIKAIENQLIRKVISSRSPSPGPGQYFGLSLASSLRNTLSVPSPTRVVTTAVAVGNNTAAKQPPPQSSVSVSVSNNSSSLPTAELRSPSPGHRGYSFGRDKLHSSMGSYDPAGQLITSVYEFKSPITDNNNNSRRSSNNPKSPSNPNYQQQESSFSFQRMNSGAKSIASNRSSLL
jgi:hypothetical protein